MAQAKIGIALPEEVLAEIDEIANETFANRSHTIVRIFLEWKALKVRQGQAEIKKNSEANSETKLNLALAA